jgi:PAS domain S-box-containing protein
MAIDNDFQLAVGKSIAELSPSGYIALDLNLIIKYSNPTVKAFLGMGTVTIQGSSALNFFQILSPTPEAGYIVSRLRNSVDLVTPDSLNITVSSGSNTRSLLQLEILPLLSEEDKTLGLLLEFRLAQENADAGSPSVEEIIRYKNVFDHSLDAIFLADDEARLTDANPAACSLTGYHLDELLRLMAWDITPDDFLLTAQELWQEFLTNGYHRGMYMIRRKDGALVDVEYTVRANINPGLHLAILRDIAAGRQTETQLEEKDQLLQGIERASPLPIILLNQDRRVALWSTAAEQLFGWSAKEVLGKYSPIVPKDQEDIFQEMIEEELQGEAHLAVEIRRMKKDGAQVDLKLWTAPVRDSHGSIIGTLRIFEDITERKRAEENLRNQKEILQTIFDHIPIMINFTDKDGHLKLVNRTWERTLGWSLEEILRQNLDIFTECYPDPQYRQEVMYFINSAQMKWADFKTRLRDGRTINTSWANTRLSDGTIIGFGQDITERRQTLKKIQQRSDRLKRSNVMISTLSQAVAQLLVNLDPDQMMHLFTEELIRIGTHFVITLLDPDDGSFVVQYSSLDRGMKERIWAKTGLHIQGLRLSKQQLSPFAELIEQRKSIFWHNPLLTAIHSFPNIPKKYLEQGLGLAGFSKTTPAISLPLLIKDQLVGAMTIWGSDLRKDDMTVLTVFANQVTIALENARLFEQVRKGREHLQLLSWQLVDVQEKERQQIARELHDEIGQTLTGLKLLLETSTNLPPEEQKINIAEAGSLLNDLMVKVREISLDLRPAMLDDLGLLPALLWHFDRFTSQTGVDVEFKQKGLDGSRFHSDVETAAYRIVQEALTNVARYAGVSSVGVTVWTAGKSLHVQVIDRGAGFEPQAVFDAHATRGIPGMRERAILCGGVLVVDSSPGKGARIYAILPLQQRIERRSDDRLHRSGG